MNEMLNSGLNKIGSSSFPEFCKIVVDNRDGLQENKYRQFTGGAFKKAERSGKLQPLEPDTVSAVVGKVYEAFLSFSFFLCFSSPFRAAVLTPSGFLVPLRAYFFLTLVIPLRCPPWRVRSHVWRIYENQSEWKTGRGKEPHS